MGKKVDTVIEAARLVGESLSHARKVASEQLSRRSTSNKPWTTVRHGLEKLGTARHNPGLHLKSDLHK